MNETIYADIITLEDESFFDDIMDAIRKRRNEKKKKKENKPYEYKEFVQKNILKSKDNKINIEGLINLYSSYANLLYLNNKDNRVMIDDLYMTNIFLDNSMILQFNVKNEEVDKFTKYDISIKVLDNELNTKDEIKCIDKDVMFTVNPCRKRLLKYNTSIESLYSFIELIDTLDEEKILENHEKLNYIKEEKKKKEKHYTGITDFGYWIEL